MEQRVSGLENKVGELHCSIKENVKSKITQEWKTRDLWDTVKRSNLQIVK